MNQMMIHEGWNLFLAGGAGMGLGLFFYGGLWFTVRRLATSRRPALLLLGSFAMRLALTLPGFYLLLVGMAGQWPPIAAALAGFFLARLLLTCRPGPATPAQKGVQHEYHP